MPEPDEGYVFLDEDDEGDWMLTHILTRERVNLGQAGLWEIGFHSVSGRGMAWRSDIDGDREEIMIFDDIFQQQLFKRADTQDLMVVHTGGPDAGLEENLSVLISKHIEGAYSLRVGKVRAHSSLRGVVFSRSRGAGMHCFISLFSLYKVLQFTAYKGLPSKWVYALGPGWSKRLAAICGPDHFVWAVGCTSATETWWQRCLAEPAVSIAGLLHLLATWAFCNRMQGGLSNESGQGKAVELLESLISAAVEPLAESGAPLVLDFRKCWAPVWPRPLPGPPGIQLSLPVAGDTVSLVPWQVGLDSGAEAWRLRRLWSVCDLERFGQACTFCQLLQAMVIHVEAHSLLGQLLIFISSHLDRHLKTQLHCQAPPADYRMTFTPTHIQDSLQNRHLLHQHLVKYVVAVRESQGDILHWSLSPDKGDQGQMSLQQAVGGFSNGVVFMAVPQVAGHTNFFQSQGWVVLVYASSGVRFFCVLLS